MEIGAPQTHYGQLVWEWTKMWQAGQVPTDEFNRLLDMQIGWWGRGLEKPNDDMIAQLESWIGVFRKQSGAAPVSGSPDSNGHAPQEEIF